MTGRRSREPNGKWREERENGWMDEKQQQQQSSQQRGSRGGRQSGRRQSKTKPYHPSKTESKPTKQQAKTYERRRPQRTNTHTYKTAGKYTHIHTQPMTVHRYDTRTHTLI